MNIRDEFGDFNKNALRAMGDFRLDRINDIIDVIINPDYNPIISGILDTWSKILGYDGAVYIAMYSYFEKKRKNDKYGDFVTVKDLSKIMKDAYVDGIKPEIFEITAICLLYSIDKGIVVQLPWINNKNDFIVKEILKWSVRNWRLLKNIHGNSLFGMIINYIHDECSLETGYRSQMTKWLNKDITNFNKNTNYFTDKDINNYKYNKYYKSGDDFNLY